MKKAPGCLIGEAGQQLVRLFSYRLTGCKQHPRVKGWLPAIAQSFVARTTPLVHQTHACVSGATEPSLLQRSVTMLDRGTCTLPQHYQAVLRSACQSHGGGPACRGVVPCHVIPQGDVVGEK